MKYKLDDGIKNIIFDIGRVLLSFDWESYLKSFGYDEETNRIIAQAVFLNPDWDLGDEGILTTSQWEEKFVENAPDYEERIREVFAGIKHTIGELPYVDEWIKYFKERGYRLFYLSNYSEKMYEETRHLMGFLDAVDGGIFSYRVKCIKPDERIYKLLLEKYNLVPEECLFFDDKAENIEAAQKLGINGVVFTPDVAYDMLRGV